jgi:LPXTG-motif cell wall-anchored protein
MNLSTLASMLLAQDDGFIGSPLFFVLGGVLFLGLIGLLLFMRSKQNSDD